jgi:hypothetical protein
MRGNRRPFLPKGQREIAGLLMVVMPAILGLGFARRDWMGSSMNEECKLERGFDEEAV